MRSTAPFMIMALLISSPAWAACENKPAAVQEYLRTHRTVFVVTLDDLVPDDKVLWQKHSGDLCPGIAEADLSGTGHKAYALALLSGSGEGRRERLVILQPGKAGQEIGKPYKYAYPAVVSRAPPDTITDFYTRKRTRVQHDMFIFEQMEASATAYFLSGGQLRHVLISD